MDRVTFRSPSFYHSRPVRCERDLNRGIGCIFHKIDFKRPSVRSEGRRIVDAIDYTCQQFKPAKLD